MGTNTKFGRLAAVMVAAAVPLVIWTQRWNIYDNWRLHGYQAPAQVAELASNTTMNDHMRRLFYVYHPDLEDKQTFSNNCKGGEQTIVLGCYIQFRGIYLYNVTDERLKGILQVTAAHEALHAVYDRLDPKEKTRVNQLIDQAYSKLDNRRIKDTIENYRKNGADTTNELHSILGTEVRNLPPELEQYYARYFTKRAAIVDFSEKYEQAFTSRKAQADSYLQQMNQVQQQLKDLKASIDRQEAALNSERASLQADRANANTPERAQAFNARVDAYNALVRKYQATIAAYNRLVATYNDLFNKYNAVAVEENDLVKAIDSRPTTIEQQ